jgi:hypothetical protein
MPADRSQLHQVWLKGLETVAFDRIDRDEVCADAVTG